MCQVEAGYECDGGEPTTCAPEGYGNGIVGPSEECDDGNVATDDGCDDACMVEFGWDCDDAHPSACTSLPSIGTFAAGDTIDDTTGGPITAGESDLWLIEFTTDVLLDGGLTYGTGDADVIISGEDGSSFIHAEVGPESWTDDALLAGRYIIEVNAYYLDGDVDTYTLTLGVDP